MSDAVISPTPVTGTATGACAHPADVTAAGAAADDAARAAGVRIRELDRVADLEAVCQLYERIWAFGDKAAPVSSELLRALSKAGSYVVGAFEGDELIGACVGFFAPPAEHALHSHIAGVSPGARGRSVGFALKVHQRAWALQRGVDEVAWTFDPLLGRNAYFNLTKLAATPAEYLVNFYGRMEDGLNRGDESDRLLVRWRLEDASVVAACAGQAPVPAPAPAAATAAWALSASATGEPVRGEAVTSTVLVHVPPQIELLRVSQPALAARWRRALRETLGGLLADGGRIRGFHRSSHYVVDIAADTAVDTTVDTTGDDR